MRRARASSWALPIRLRVAQARALAPHRRARALNFWHRLRRRRRGRLLCLAHLCKMRQFEISMGAREGYETISYCNTPTSNTTRWSKDYLCVCAACQSSTRTVPNADLIVVVCSGMVIFMWLLCKILECQPTYKLHVGMLCIKENSATFRLDVSTSLLRTARYLKLR